MLTKILLFAAKSANIVARELPGAGAEEIAMLVLILQPA
jgi:hypothetical protein